MSAGLRVGRSATLAALGAAMGAGQVDPGSWGPALFAMGLIVGLPHGALDHKLAERSQSWRNPSGQVLFHLTYLLIVASVLLGWWLAPAAGLLLLLLSALLHFGESDLIHLEPGARSPQLVLSRGLVVLGTPMLIHPEVAAQMFAEVAGTPIGVVAPLPGRLAGAAIATSLFGWHCYMLLSVLPARLARHEVLGAAAVALLGAGGGPLLGFTAYFVLWHTPDHVAAVVRASGLSGWRAFYRLAAAAAPRTVLGLVGLTGLVMLVDPADWTRLTLCGVAALTLPHAVTVHLALGEPKGGLTTSGVLLAD